MDTAKIFTSGNSQAVRLPKDYRFDEKEVYIKRTADGVLLIPKSQSQSIWEIWEENLGKYDEPLERNQPMEQQVREGLDELFD